MADPCGVCGLLVLMLQEQPSLTLTPFAPIDIPF